MKQELDMKSAELEELKDKVLNERDIEMIRLKIAEELDTPHRIQINSLQLVRQNPSTFTESGN